MRYLFISKNLIGDGLYISGALRSWLKQAYKLGEDEIYMSTLDDHIAPLYYGMVRDFVAKDDFHIVFERPEGEFRYEHTFDVTPVFQLSHQKKMHIAECYAELMGVKLEGFGKFALKPTFIPEYNKDVEEHNWELLELHDCILVSMYSMSCSSRGTPPGPPNKMLPWEKWKPMIEILRKEFPTNQIRTLGGPMDTGMTPVEFRTFLHEHYVEPMHAIPLNRLAVIMKNAKLLVTIDNGMGHLAASQETPTFLMYPRALMPHYILPIGNKHLDWVHMDPNTVSATSLRERLAYRIRKLKESGR